MVLGLLPCGLRVLGPGRGHGHAAARCPGRPALAVFGLGTVPALVGVSFADTLLVRRRAVINRLSHVFVLVMGAWYLWRGIGPLPLN